MFTATLPYSPELSEPRPQGSGVPGWSIIKRSACILDGKVSTISEQTGSRSFQLREDQVLLILTLIIGAVVGLVVVAFILVTENLGSRLYPATAAHWRRFAMPVIGSLTAGLLLARYFPAARGSGIPQTKTALFIRDGYISLRTVLGKFGLCSVTLASGIALGREGPSVQIGAGIASVLGRRLGLSASSIKALVPVGASAALAAAFNTPIAAVLFSLEEVMGDLHAPVLGSIVLGSATSWIVLHLLLGDEPLFHVPAYQLVHPVEFVFYALLGVAGGIVSVAFVKLLLWQRKHFLRLPKSTAWAQPAAGGLLVGILGWFVPSVLGVGYSYVGQALNGQMALKMMALLVILKLVSTATCYSSGNAGGIFGPSLFIGAMLGGSVGAVAHLMMPDYTGGVGAYALAGMGAAFAGIVRVPLASVIMIFEMTRDYSIIVPVMIANLTSYFISSRLQPEPIYEALQHQDGLHLPSGARAREELLTVGHAFRPESQVLSATETVDRAVKSVDREQAAWPVTDANGLRGIVGLAMLEETVRQGRGDVPLAAIVPDPGPFDSLVVENFPHIHPDHSLDLAMRRLNEAHLAILPVVSRANVRELKGTISLKDILNAYAVGVPRAEEPKTTVTGRPRLLAGLLAVLVGVALLSGFLNYYFRAERIARAEHFYEAGRGLAAKERYDEAIEQFRNAVSVSHSMQHRLGLGMTLVEAGRYDDGAIYLREVLRENPASGPANLGLARVDVHRGDIDGAAIYYQRAIVGTWPEKPDENRFQARVEFVQALKKAARGEQAHAELLAAAASTNDLASKKQLGRMLIDFGLYQNAAALFTQIAREHRTDTAAWNGLGEAQLAAGNYRAARDAFQTALIVDPADPNAVSRRAFVEKILELDPTLPGLSAAARHDRSRELLAAAAAELAPCEATESPDRQAAAAELARHKRPASYSDAADANIALARRVWTARNAECPKPAADDDPLTRLLGPGIAGGH